MVLETERLILRPWEENDAASLFEFARDPEVGPIAGWPVHQNIGESLNVIRTVLSGEEAYAVCLKADNRAIGAIELKLNGHTDLTENDDECELGYWIGKPFWGRGLVPEAAERLLRHAFEDLGMNTVWCGCYDANFKSKRVQEKLGFQYQYTSFGLDVPLMHEKRTGHVSALSKQEWEKRHATNPWEMIMLDDYENHMRLDSVRQLQALNAIMSAQFDAFPVKAVTILGVAGGNGLEHLRGRYFDIVYAVDINRDYLSSVQKRYGDLSPVLRCLHLDLINDAEKLPHSELVIADLIVEYIGYSAFQRVIRRIRPKYISCVVQHDTGCGNWVSDSPYIHVFDGLETIHHSIDPDELAKHMQDIGFFFTSQDTVPLPNGKELIRLDFVRNG